MSIKLNKKYRVLVLMFFTASFFVSGYAQTINRKSIFLTDTERARLMSLSSTSTTASLLSAMQARVTKRAASPGLSDKTATTEWWHHAAEYLTDAALIHAVRPTEKIDAWLRACVLDIIRRPLADWAGPGFRKYDGGELVGQLETSHLTWGIGIAYDLAADLFNEAETVEIKTALKEKGLIPCRRYLDKSAFCHNWNCVLLAGYSVAAVLLNDEKAIEEANAWMPTALDHFQKDGSYGESLQYGNYTAYSLMIAQEALQRYNPSNTITLNPYGKIVNWSAYSFLYRKPLSGWPMMDWPRSVNFGDCAAIFRPSGDLLIHIAARAKKEMPQEAGLAAYLFNTLYFPANEPGPHDLASFGFVNGFGFLSVIMLADAAKPISIADAKLPVTAAFSSGDAFARDAWNGLTTLAVRIPSEPRHATPHIHGDINSFILVYNKERLLVDPGHTCYREFERDFDINSESHNTCTFEKVNADGSINKILQQKLLTQSGLPNRKLNHVNAMPIATDPLDIGGKRLLINKVGNVSVIAANAAELYGVPIKTFSRFFVLCGSHALFIIDNIEAAEPIKTTWNFLLNNRDGLLDYSLDRINNSFLGKRGNAGIKVMHFAKDNLTGPIYALVHDAYHTLPAQARSEGEPGTGIAFRWNETTAATKRTMIHAIAVDEHAAIDNWKIKSEDNNYSVEGKDRNENWVLHIATDEGLMIEEINSKQKYSVVKNAVGVWELTATPSK